jgi:thiol:disulfide interchange protein
MHFFKTNFLLLILFTFFSACAFAQDSSIIKWTATASKTSEGNYEVSYKGVIKKGWYLYSIDNKTLEIDGVKTAYDSSFIKANAFKLITSNKEIEDAIFQSKVQIISDSISFTEQVNFSGKVPSSFETEINYSVSNGVELNTEKPSVKISTGEKSTATASSNRILIPTINIDRPLTNAKTSVGASTDDVKSKGLFSLFALGFLGGLIALLTPCVFPMIPLTVSFFTKKAQSKQVGIRNAFLYGFFIFLIYVLITVPFHIFDKLNPDIFNGISTNVVLNVIFFIVFVAFALSFFGLYEITLPSSITNSSDSKANAGTVTGIFFMALTLTIVSFSCTGPLAGSLLAGAVSGPGGAMRLSFGMAGFGAALGLPFALFALFPEMLKSLPKSGGWLTTVKVVLGFLELGFAFKFLSNADLVQHWGLLKREVFIGIWIIIGALLSLYLWGILKFKNDAPIKKLSVGRKLVASFFTILTLYLLPGITNTKYANLSLISGFPPPLNYTIYTKDEIVTNSKNTGENNNCVLNLNCSHDYEEGLKMAREQKKPILLDFTGYACVNCRRMEENVWSDARVYKLLKEKFIVISLYVDDKKNLPSDERFTYTTKDGNKRDIKTVGDKWSVFETENFRSNSQPLYAILNNNEELVSVPSGYAPSVVDYLNWLQAGLDDFEGK